MCYIAISRIYSAIRPADIYVAKANPNPQEEEEEEREEPDEPVPEHGPPLLNPISEDSEVDSMPAWSAGLTSNLVPQYAAAVLRSNLWPGACVFGLDKKFENLYIGMLALKLYSILM